MYKKTYIDSLNRIANFDNNIQLLIVDNVSILSLNFKG